MIGGTLKSAFQLCSLTMVYFGLVLWLLWHGIHIWSDGEGPSPGLWFGVYPRAHTWAEYRIDPGLWAHLLVPYLIAAVVLTAIGAFVYFGIGRIWPQARATMMAAAVLDLLLVVGTAASYDLGLSLKLWTGGRFLGEIIGLTPYSFQILLQVWLPIALLTGLCAKLLVAGNKRRRSPQGSA
jgi:hypothetical protein